jgi:serine/threonine protein kinase
MKVKVQGGSEVDLSQKNFLAAGGEGQIYVIGDTTYKIYTDPAQMIPVGKITELGEIQNPYVIKPEQVLLGSKNIPIGFTSKFVHNEGALCQLFTRAFRDRNGVTPGHVGELVKKLQSIVSGVHQAKCLVVDLNEMNFLLGSKLQDIYAIDVASYQTPHYRATALMESVRDRHMKHGQFNEGTDWFAFAILSFQMFIGIHPYKGKHPSIRGLDDRMLQNISVLHKDVGIPQTCYPISSIPKNYLDWYGLVLEKGQRTPPPSGFLVVAVPVKMTQATGSVALEIREIGSYDSNITDVWEHLGSLVVATHNSVYLDNRRTGDGSKGIVRGVGFTRSNKPITASTLDGFTLEDQVNRETVPTVLTPSEFMSYDGTLYARTGDKILALTLTEIGSQNKVLAGPVVAANVLEHATRLYPGTAIQSLLGACYVSMFPVAGTHHQIRIPELDGVRIQDAKYDTKVLMVVGFKAGVYNRWIFRFDDQFQEYDTRVIPDIKPEGLNFVTLDSGICVSMTEDETLELFPNTKGANKLRTVADSALSGEMKLYKKAGKVVFTKNNKLYSLSLK